MYRRRSFLHAVKKLTRGYDIGEREGVCYLGIREWRWKICHFSGVRVTGGCVLVVTH